MPSPSDHERLVHIQEAINLIIEHCEQFDLAAFRSDRKSQLLIERLLEIIGQAANHISPELKAAFPDVPWRAMTDMRNVVSHEYFLLRVEIIWDVVTQEIPNSRSKLRLYSTISHDIHLLFFCCGYQRT